MEIVPESVFKAPPDAAGVEEIEVAGVCANEPVENNEIVANITIFNSRFFMVNPFKIKYSLITL